MMSAVWVAVLTAISAISGALISKAFDWLAAKRAMQSADAKAALEARTADNRLQVEGAAQVRDLLWDQVAALREQVGRLEQKIDHLQAELTERDTKIIALEAEIARKDLLLSELAVIARSCPQPRDKCPVRMSGILPVVEPTGRFRVQTVPSAVPVDNGEEKKS